MILFHNLKKKAGKMFQELKRNYKTHLKILWNHIYDWIIYAVNKLWWVVSLTYLDED